MIKALPAASDRRRKKKERKKGRDVCRARAPVQADSSSEKRGFTYCVSLPFLGLHSLSFPSLVLCRARENRSLVHTLLARLHGRPRFKYITYTRNTHNHAHITRTAKTKPHTPVLPEKHTWVRSLHPLSPPPSQSTKGDTPARSGGVKKQTNKPRPSESPQVKSSQGANDQREKGPRGGFLFGNRLFTGGLRLRILLFLLLWEGGKNPLSGESGFVSKKAGDVGV